jgi:arabinogalactan endo-1,4-beta-galactosidase
MRSILDDMQKRRVKWLVTVLTSFDRWLMNVNNLDKNIQAASNELQRAVRALNNLL